MVRFKKFFNNGKPAWEFNASAIALAIISIVVLALFSDNASEAISWVVAVVKAAGR